MDRRLVSIVLALIVWQPSQALSETTDLYALSLEDLLSVTIESTSFFDESLVSTNYSVSVSNQDDWQLLAVRNVGELLNRMPSTVAPIGFGQSRYVAIRGYADASAGTGTALRYDGVPMNKIREGGGMMALDGFDLALLESTELIRGPGSSLHGNDAFHGALSLQPIQLKQGEFRASASAGAFDYSAASVVGHVGSDNNGLSLGIAYRNIGDVGQAYSFIDSDSGSVASGYRKVARENLNALAKYHYQSGALAIDGTVFWLDFDAEQLRGVGEQPFGNQQDKDWSNYGDKNTLGKLSANYKISDGQNLHVSAFYWEYDDVFSVDLTGTIFGRRLQGTRRESHSGAQIHHMLELSEQSNITYGYEFLSITLDEYRESAYDASGNLIYGGSDSFGTGYNRNLHSALVDGRQALNSSGLVLTYGLRVDSYNDFDTQITPRLALSQFFDNKQSVHISYGEGFRAPALFELFGTEEIPRNDALQPERIKNIEIKYKIETELYFHQITAFKNRWNDAIQFQYFDEAQPGGLGQFENIGKSSARGLEYELNARWDRFRADVSLSYAKDKNDDTGQDYRSFPEWMSDINLGYQINAHWSLNNNNRWMRMEQGGGIENAGKYFSYLRSDIVVQWQSHKGFSASFALRNILDKTNRMPGDSSQAEGQLDDERNLSTQIEYRF